MPFCSTALIACSFSSSGFTNLAASSSVSSLNASFPNEEEYGPLRVGKTFIEENYGVIIVDSNDNDMFVGIKNINGEIVRNITISN